mgnify:CR=1 FL=1
MYDQKSGRAFLERTGLIPAHSNPEPRLAPCTHLVHTIPLQAPLPPPALTQLAWEAYAPDRYQAQAWPHDEAE